MALDLVEEDLTLLSYRYGFRIESPEARMRDGIEMMGGSGGMSGIRMNGDSFHYTIRANIAECRLDRLGVDGQGRGVVVETTDIRSLKRLETDSLGPVVISRRKLKTSLPDTLRGVARFRGFSSRRSDRIVVSVVATAGAPGSVARPAARGGCARGVGPT